MPASLDIIMKQLFNFLVPEIDSAYSAESSAGAAVSVNVAPPGGSGKRAFINKIICSYSEAPTGGCVNVYIGDPEAGRKFRVDILVGGPVVIPIGIFGPTNGTLTVSLEGGGGSVVGKLNVIGGVR